MCGVSACENRQNHVSHGESVRVGSSVCVRACVSVCVMYVWVKPAAVQKNTVKPAAIEINVRVYCNDYGNHRNNTKGTRF